MSASRASPNASRAWSLSRIGEPGDPRLTDLVHELGGETVLEKPA